MMPEWHSVLLALLLPVTTALCPPGHYRLANACHACGTGTWSRGGLATTCRACPLGTTAQHLAAASPSECRYCRAGYAYTPDTNTLCTPCPTLGNLHAHQRPRCEHEPFGGNVARYQDWGFERIDRAVQALRGDRSFLQDSNDLTAQGFTRDLDFVPNATLPRSRFATGQDYYHDPTSNAFFTRKALPPDSDCHVYNVWSGGPPCFLKGRDYDGNAVSLIAQLRRENYCSERATQHPFTVHVLPIHRSEYLTTDQENACGFLKLGGPSRQVLDIATEDASIDASLAYYDLRRFMYQAYTTRTEAGLREKLGAGDLHLRKVMEFLPGINTTDEEFRPHCRDKDLYRTDACTDPFQNFDTSYETCPGESTHPHVDSILYHLFKDMHCDIAGSTARYLRAVVRNVTTRLQETPPGFVAQPLPIVLDNPCAGASSVVKVSVNGGLAMHGEDMHTHEVEPGSVVKVRVESEDGGCAFETVVAVNASQRGLVFARGAEAGQECAAGMEHAQEFGIVLKAFDELVVS